MSAPADLIARCACKTAEGHYVLHKFAKEETGAEGDKEGETGPAAPAKPVRKKARRAVEGEGNELTFIMNPNPELFADQGQETAGGTGKRHFQVEIRQLFIDGNCEFHGFNSG